jgi:glycosyltransferase involved in cell wall biosynthesis
MGMSLPRISIVLPTYNRAEALCLTLPELLKVRGVSELIVVDDGSTDETASVLEEMRDERLRIVYHDDHRGQPAARNSGVGAASGEWILFGEDDCVLPVDYALALHGEAVRHGADIVGAPWLNVSEDERERALASGRAAAVTHVSLDTHPSSFPAEPLRTPFLPALALVRQEVFAWVRFHEGFRGNAYREETDFFVSAARQGFVCLLSPRTASFQALHSTGGARTTPLRYEYWAWRNNRLFLQRHGSWLRQHGYTGSPLIADLRFAARRFAGRLRSRMRASEAWR